jgi:5'-nucleotidase
MEELFNKIERKRFLGALSWGLASAPLIGKNAFAHEREPFITILHTNDVHSHLDSFPMNHPKYPGLGGAEARALVVSNERLLDPDLLLLDAGDMFQGTPYYNFFGGEPEVKIMNHLRYDAATLGNHEFDSGIEGLDRALQLARFSVLNCNYGFDGTPLIKKVQPFKIIFKKGIKIGLLGVGVHLSGLVDRKLTQGVKCFDPVEAANNISKFLKLKKKCDLVICLSHLGFQYSTNQVSDVLLAKRSAHIDVIIGGHTHTFMDEPVFELNAAGRKVLISQMGWAGLRLGKIIVNFQGYKQEKKLFSGEVIEIKKSRAN